MLVSTPFDDDEVAADCVGAPAVAANYAVVTGVNYAIYYRNLDSQTAAWTKIPAATYFGPAAATVW
jgi:hypothetical protein